jgi:hypothetical protein
LEGRGKKNCPQHIQEGRTNGNLHLLTQRLKSEWDKQCKEFQGRELTASDISKFLEENPGYSRPLISKIGRRNTIGEDEEGRGGSRPSLGTGGALMSLANHVLQQEQPISLVSITN